MENENTQPELSALSPSELDDLEVTATEAFDALNGKDSLTAEEIAELATLADSVAAVRAEKDARAAAQEQLNEQRAALAAQVHPPQASDTPDEAEAAPEEEAAPEGDDAPAEDASTAPVPVAASATPRPQVNIGAIRRHAPARSTTPTPTPRSGVTITAAADVPGVPMASVLTTIDDLGAAMAARARVLPVVASGGQFVPVASIDLGIEESNWLGNDAEQNARIISAAANPSNLTAAGWCAPVQQTYDFFSIEATDGLIDLPTVGTDRGTIQWPHSPTMADVQAALWTWTEQMDIDAAAGGQDAPSKPCLMIPCATFDECVLQADGLCLTASNLTERGFPELVRRYVQLTMAAHMHRVSANILSKMATFATDVTIGAGALVSDAFGDLMGAIDLQVADYRSQFKMSANATLEVVIPDWTRAMLRANLAQRAGFDALAVTDAQLASHFAARNVRVQYVADWLPLFSANPATAWPATIKFLVYAAGTFIKASGGVLDLGVVRDSTLNKTNDHVAAWSEEFYCVGMVGHAAREVTVGLSVDGVTGCCDAPAAP